MQLVVLGSGTSVPHPQRASAGFWIDTGSGTMLLDCSADVPHRMAEEHLDWPHLDAIWISHLHLDHCGGLAPLLFGMKWAPQTQTRTKPLKIFGCPGVERTLTALNDANDYKLFDQPFRIELHEVTDNDQSRPLAQVSFETFKTPHTRESLALRLSGPQGKSLVYSSDTGYAEELGEFAHGADLLILECSFHREKTTPNHLELAEAMRIAKIAEPRKLLLTHLYPEWDGVDLEAEARALWPGEAIAAMDGLRLEI
jgi:ribonuclease BN (tRNA processing enzyme)